MMTKLRKILADYRKFSIGIALFTGVVLFSNNASLPQDTATAACVCKANISFNSQLPSSHPLNRCAQQSQQLNWASWLSGKSKSNQFHFFDLLELLHKESPSQPTINSNENQLN
ncbi:MAG: hypothetical protein ACPGUD_02075 [Parashewanella sp.]